MCGWNFWVYYTIHLANSPSHSPSQSPALIIPAPAVKGYIRLRVELLSALNCCIFPCRWHPISMFPPPPPTLVRWAKCSVTRNWHLATLLPPPSQKRVSTCSQNVSAPLHTRVRLSTGPHMSTRQWWLRKWLDTSTMQQRWRWKRPNMSMILAVLRKKRSVTICG